MKKSFFIAFMLIVCLFSAALAEDTPAVYVDGTPIPESLVESRLSMSNYMNSSLSEEEQAEKKKQAREAVLEQLIQEQVCLNDAGKNGIRLEGAVLADAQSRYNRMISNIEAYIRETYENLTEDELSNTVDSLLAATGSSREDYQSIAQRSAVLDAYYDFLLSSMPNPDEEAVQGRYQQILAQQKEEFSKDENRFESAMLGGELVLYRPVDLKMIQKIEFLFDDEAISIIRSTRQYNEDAANEMVEDQYTQLDPHAEEVCEKLRSGEMTFAEAMEQEKPGSSAKVNYFHPSSTRFSQDYYDRANGFSTPGEISSLYRIQNGYGLLYYLGLLSACNEVPYEQVRESIVTLLREESTEEYLAQKKQQLLEEAVITYPEASQP